MKSFPMPYGGLVDGRTVFHEITLAVDARGDFFDDLSKAGCLTGSGADSTASQPSVKVRVYRLTAGRYQERVPVLCA